MSLQTRLGALITAIGADIKTLFTRTNSLNTMASQAATAVNIDGGTIDGTVIGGVTQAAGSFTTLTTTDVATVSANSTSPALKVTQTGSGNALWVEDSASSDSTPFVVGHTGGVGVGVADTVTYGKLSVAGGTTGATPTLSLQPEGTAQGQRAVAALYGTFEGTGDNGPRRVADIVGGFSGAAWGAEFLAFHVGNNGGLNDTRNLTSEKMRVSAQGTVAIGSATTRSSTLLLSKPQTGATSTFGIRNQATIQSDSTANGIGFSSAIGTAAATFTLAYLAHFRVDQGIIGAGSTVIGQYGFLSSNLSGATNNYGFYSDLYAGTGKWNFYSGGNAPNYFAGNVGIGAEPITNTTANIQSNADIGLSGLNRGLMLNVYFSGGWKYAANGYAGFIKSDDSGGGGVVIGVASLNSSGAGAAATPLSAVKITAAGNLEVITPALLGYGTGAGGTVTQVTSKATAVTLNKPTGRITMHNAALGASEVVDFQLNNSLVTANDLVITNSSGNSNYRVDCLCVFGNLGSGGVVFRVTNISAGTLSDALSINFAIIKGSAS